MWGTRMIPGLKPGSVGMLVDRGLKPAATPEAAG